MKLANLIKKFNQSKITGTICLSNPFAKLRRKLLLPLLSAFLVVLCIGCQDSGLVGTKMPSTGTKVTTDTFSVASIQSLSLETYTGKRRYMSVGAFHDPLFGDIKATGMMLPVLIGQDSAVTFDLNTRMKLKLYFHTKSVYGDTTASETFKLVPITQRWRGKEHKIHEDIHLNTGQAVGSFTVGQQDSLVVPLSKDFFNRYLSFYSNTDSTKMQEYRNQFYGFAIVPQNSNKIVAINAHKSHFLITGAKFHTDSTTSRDTLKFRLKDWAYTLKRSNVSQAGPKSTKIVNTLENVMRLDLHLSTDDINPRNVSKAELVIYRNTKKLKTSLSAAGTNLARPESDTLYIYHSTHNELLKTLDPLRINTRIPRLPALYNEKDHAYHFYLNNRLSWIVNSNSNVSLYLVPNVNNGIIRENLLFNNQASDSLQPKIIITHTNIK